MEVLHEKCFDSQGIYMVRERNVKNGGLDNE